MLPWSLGLENTEEAGRGAGLRAAVAMGADGCGDLKAIRWSPSHRGSGGLHSQGLWEMTGRELGSKKEVKGTEGWGNL